MISEPIKGPFGWHIFKVTAIEPAYTQKFQTIKAKIKDDLISTRSCEIAKTFIKKYRQSDKTSFKLDEFAKQNNLRINDGQYIAGYDKEFFGSLQHNFPEMSEQFTKFSANLKKLNNNYSNNFSKEIFAIFNVTQIYPERTKTLDEVKGLVTTAWQEDKLRNALQVEAEKITKKVSNYSKFKRFVAKNKHISLKRNLTLSRDHNKYSAELISEIFTLKKGEHTKPIFNTKTDNIEIAILNNIIDPELNALEKQKILLSIGQNIREEFNKSVESQFQKYLIKKYDVQISTETQ